MAADNASITWLLEKRLSDHDDCAAVCAELGRQGIPFVFHTAHDDPLPGWEHIPLVMKPALPAEVINGLVHVSDQRRAANAAGRRWGTDGLQVRGNSEELDVQTVARPVAPSPVPAMLAHGTMRSLSLSPQAVALRS